MAKIDKIKVGSTTYDVGGGGYLTCELPAFTNLETSASATVSVSGITADDHPVLDVITSTDATVAETQISDWSKIYAATTGNGTITFYANDITSQALNISIKL